MMTKASVLNLNSKVYRQFSPAAEIAVYLERKGNASKIKKEEGFTKATKSSLIK